MRGTATMLLGALAVACGSAAIEEGSAESEVPGLVFTHWTERTELFVELPVLRVGAESPCAAHVTILDGFRAPPEGSVTVVLSGGGAAEERFTTAAPSIPGIFRPVAVPRTAGTRQLRFELALGELTDVHDLGEVRVYASDEEAIADAPPEEDHPGRIVFLKEQQWPIEFGTDVVREGTIAPALSVPASLRPRDDGDAWIVAPSVGRVLAPEAGFPRLGGAVERDALVATLSPQLESTDRASLDLARVTARIDVDQAARERERLEGLVAGGAVPERRLVEAQHAEMEARAALTAAERRSGQFRSVQRAGRGGSTVDLRAPISGVIAEVRVAPGALVAADDRLFRVIDPSVLWLEVRVPDADASAFDGQRGGWVDIDGIERPIDLGPGEFVARAPMIDMESHTLRVVYALANAAGDLTAGTLATAHLYRGEPVPALVVPRSAIVEDGAATVVYVQVEGEAFERRVVRVLGRERDRVGVAGALVPGEHVAVRGAYAVRLAASSGSAPAHGHAH
jgi:cobalt-zinc-cadmium efflux system membrane fusion protein